MSSRTGHRLSREQAKAALQRAAVGEGPAAVHERAVSPSSTGLTRLPWWWIGGATAGLAGVGALLGTSSTARRMAFRGFRYALRYAWYVGILKLFGINMPLPPPPSPAPPPRKSVE